MSQLHQPNTLPVSPAGETGLYIHLPFCASRCNYCDFYSGVGTEEEIAEYTKSVIKAIGYNKYTGRSADTIYFGGGTPSLLSLQQFEGILGAVRQHFSLSQNAEITLEANPETVSEALLGGLVSLGFTRISFGVQSGVDKELAALERRHNAQTARKSILLAARVGFPHISADLMLGIPFQTKQTLRESTGFLTALPLDHISAYLLGLEPTVPLHNSPLLQACMGETELAEAYLQTVEDLTQKGFSQYEISNFARPGGQSRHNLKYWTLAPYLGIGPSAHSFMEGKRFYFPPERDSFVESSSPFELLVPDGTGGEIEEHLLLGLRLTQGISVVKIKNAYPQWDKQSFLSVANTLQAQGLVQVAGDTISLTPKGFLLSNQVIAALIL